MLLPYMADATLGATLLLSGVMKMGNRRHFADVVRAYQLLPRTLAPGFASTFPIAEALVGTALLSRILWNSPLNAWVGVAAVFLFVMFGVAISINLLRGRTEISCGCFGSTSRRLTWGLAARAFACMAMGLITLPVLRPLPAATSALDRLSAAFVGAALVAAAWLGNFIFSQMSVPLEPQS
jgi:hypothetical protein